MSSSLAFKLEADSDFQNSQLESASGPADAVALDFISPEFAAFNQTDTPSEASRRPHLQVVPKASSTSTSATATKATNSVADSPQFAVAGSYRRMLAYYLDGLVLLIVMLPAGMHLLRNVVSGRDAVVSWFWMGFTVFAWALYQALFLRFYGATAGKSAMDLRVVSLNPSSPQLTWTQVCVRALGTIVAGMFGYLFYAVALLRKDRRHVVDLIAQTQVIQDGLKSRHKPRRFVIGVLAILFALVGLTQQKYKITARGLEFKKNKVAAAKDHAEDGLKDRQPANADPQEESQVE